ncbi:hypothetical protein AVENLUH5627_01325 [Acinetobacter venetianus]|uniref:DUF2071 domain-containing protein n=2 Tax=Acinetobacter venetianus TaxID=52133 RepID=A0A150HUJ4_9GAMM|nr:hypothetical protein AVENLUH5627_01325 [Acinetobacter venetianus]
MIMLIAMMSDMTTMNRHRFKPPKQNTLFQLLAKFLSCRLILQLRRLLMRCIPFMRLESQVKDIVYLSWLVDVEQVRQHYPSDVPLWEKQGKTIFTILTYQHQHFGFRFLGGLRQWMPSPQQSNWRFYLDHTYPKTVIFEQVLLDQYLYVMGGRLASDVMPAQYASVFQHQFNPQQQSIQTDVFVDTDYSFNSDVKMTQEKTLTPTWQQMFDSWDEAVQFLVDQDHAWAEWVDRPECISQGDIEMPVQYEDIRAAQILSLNAPALLKKFGVESDTDAFAFVVPALDFHVLGERFLEKSN